MQRPEVRSSRTGADGVSVWLAWGFEAVRAALGLQAARGQITGGLTALLRGLGSSRQFMWNLKVR